MTVPTEGLYVAGTKKRFEAQQMVVLPEALAHIFWYGHADGWLPSAPGLRSGVPALDTGCASRQCVDRLSSVRCCPNRPHRGVQSPVR